MMCFRACAQGLDAHCGRCGAKLNRRFLERTGRGVDATHPQGRPLGLLLAWLQEPCGGDALVHRSRVTTVTAAERIAARAWGQTVGSLGPLFERERPRRAGEPAEPVLAP